MGSTDKTKLIIEVDSKGVVTANKELVKLTNTGKKTETATKKMETSWTKLSGIMKAAAGPLVLGAVILKVIKLSAEFGKAASDAEEVGSKYATVFRTMGKDAEDMADKFADSFGLARSTSREMLGATGDILTGFGVSTKAAADLSVATNSLAVDLASFTNAAGGAKAVSNALVSAYSGQTRALRTYGIVITQAAIEEEILAQKQAGVTYESERQAEIYATLKLATEQSKNAVGDMSRTWDSTANVGRRLEESTKALKEELGKTVNKGVTPFKIALDKVVKGVADWIEAQNKLITFQEEQNKAMDAVKKGTATVTQEYIAQAAVVEELSQTLDNLKYDDPSSRAIPTMEKELRLAREKLRNMELEVAYNNELTKSNITKGEAADVLAKKQAEMDKASKGFRDSQLSADEVARNALQDEINKWWEYRGVLEGATEYIDAMAKARDVLNDKIKAAGTDPIVNSQILAGLKEELDLYDKLPNEILKYKLQQEGANDEDIRGAIVLNNLLTSLKKKADLEERGVELTKQYRSAQDEYNAGVAEANDLLAAGDIDAETYANRIRDLKENMVSVTSVMKDMSKQLLALAGNEGISAMHDFGESLASGADGADSFKHAMVDMVNNMLQQLPMMLLSAGLQLIAAGMWQVGLGLVAASGLIAIGAGYADYKLHQNPDETANALGNIYDDGNIIPFSKGSAFTNSIVTKPTLFPMANGGLGLMGEAGAEAIMPLTRTADGSLGVKAEGTVGEGSNVEINIINNTSEKAEVKQSTDNNGKQIYSIIIGSVKQGMARGEFDGDMGSNYGVRRQGVAG